MDPTILGQSGPEPVKEYSTFLRAPELEPHHKMQFSVIPRTSLYGESFTSLQRKELAYSNVSQ